jgi:hypothetical protein
MAKPQVMSHEIFLPTHHSLTRMAEPPDSSWSQTANALLLESDDLCGKMKPQVNESRLAERPRQNWTALDAEEELLWADSHQRHFGCCACSQWIVVFGILSLVLFSLRQSYFRLFLSSAIPERF